MPVVKSPLSIIALFVSLVEAFLAYPVTQLESIERLIMVIFMTSFPFFVASLFFYLLWHRPLHLYSPQDIPSALQDRYQAKAAEATAREVLFEEIQERPQVAIPSEAAVITPAAATRLAEEREWTIESDVRAVQAEVRARIESAGTTDESAVEEAKRAVQRTRHQSKRTKARLVEEEMSKFRDWLTERGFTDLPDLPEVVIEPPSVFNAYSNLNDNTAHFGALISEDSDTIAHTYFHNVLHSLGALSKFAGETGALVEGFCDYYACSYNGDPYLGEKFAEAAGLESGWIRNLEQVVRLGAQGDPYSMGLVWSGGCWELRERYGADKIDSAIRLTLANVRPDSTISQAALILRDQLTGITDEQAKDEVRRVFQKRGVEIPN